MSVFSYLLLAACALVSLPAVAADGDFAPIKGIALTDAERAFIAAHPLIRVSNEDDWPPFDFSVNGEPRGYAVEYMQLLAGRAGLELQFVNGRSWETLLAMAERQELDVLQSAERSPEREQVLRFTRAFLDYDLTLVTRRDGRADGLADVEGRRLAVVGGYAVHDRLAEDHPGLTTVAFDSPLDALRAVSGGKADAYVDHISVVEYLIGRHVITNLRTAGPVHLVGPAPTLHIGVRRDWPELHSILQKAMDSVTEAELIALRGRWIRAVHEAVAAPIDADESLRQAVLTAEQRKHLLSLGRVTLCVDPDWMPYESIDEQGRHVGMAADYIQRIALRLPVPFELVPTATWSESLERARARDCDVLSLLNPSPARSQFLEFTTPYINAPIVLVGTDDSPYLGGLQALEGRTVAVVEGYIHEERLRRDYPNIELITVPTVAEGLHRVSNGEIDAQIASLFVVTHEIQRAQLSNLKIAGHTEYTHALSIGVRDDAPLLLSALDQAVRSLSPEEHNAIRRAWTATRFEMGTDYSLALQVFAAALLALGAIFLWNRKLTRLNAQINAQSAIVDEHVLLTGVDLEGTLTTVSEAYCRATGYAREQLLGKPASIVLHSDNPAARCDQIWDAVKRGKTWHGEMLDRRADGSALWVDATVSPRYEQGRLTGFTSMRHDISDKKRIETLSITDELTGLFNRRYFNETFLAVRERVRQQRRYFAFLIIDVDQFKRFNDLHGHLEGDEVLRRLGAVLREQLLRADDLAFRLGGEEFGCVYSADSAEGAESTAERLRAAVEGLGIAHPGNPPHGRVTVSIGMQLVGPERSMDKELVYSAADTALYRAKAAGRNRVAVAPAAERPTPAEVG